MKSQSSTDSDVVIRSRCLYHPNIALLIAICNGPTTMEQYLVFEPLEYHFLHRLLFEEKAKLEEDSILKIAHDVVNAMQYVHNMGFLHCYLGAHSVIVTRDYTAKVYFWILLHVM
jgi:serine/threonine protein kinase